MKGVLGWVKSNILVVILAVVTVISLPTLLFLSMRMSNKLRTEVQESVNKDLREIQQLSVTYRMPSIDPAAPGEEWTRPPNAPTTEALRQAIEALQSQSETMVQLAVERNSAGKTPMLEGLFPEPDPGQETRLRQEVNGVWLRAHDDILKRARAGMPPDAGSLAEFLLGRHEQEKSRMGGGETLTPEAEQEIRERLTGLRMGRYRDRARDVTFYADRSAFKGVEPWADNSLPTLPQIWDWQHRLWVHEDIIEAMRLANRDPITNAPLPAPEAPVKRVLSISVPSWALDGVTTPPVSASVDSPIPFDREASPTGRAGWPLKPNPLYDVRYALVSIVVSGRDLPRVLDAIAHVNFMTVLDVEISNADADQALQEGFVYGGAHVVEATLLIETLWLRSWMAPLMPQAVRDALGAPGAKAAPGAGTDQWEDGR